MRASRVVALAALLASVCTSASILPRGGSRSGFQFVGTILGSANVAASSLALGGGNSGVFDTGNAEGWVVQSATAAAGQTFSVVRQGFAAGGATTSYAKTFTVTKLLRKAYFFGTTPIYAAASQPNTQNLWALSDYVLSTDTPSGFVNNSTLIAPMPVAGWTEPARTVVGNSIHVGVAAFSRDAGAGGQGEVAAVCFTAYDGTTTTTPTCTSTMVKSATYGDPNPVLDYEASIDVSGLADNHIVTVNAKVYPWVGASGSVLDSSTITALRGFSPRYYYKSTVRAASPYVAFVNSSGAAAGSCAAAGNDTTGKWSQTLSTAYGLCFATFKGALDAMSSGTLGIPASQGLPAGAADGAIVYLSAATNFNTGRTANIPQSVAGLIITRDAALGSTKPAITLSNVRPRLGWSTGVQGTITAPALDAVMQFRYVTVVRGTSSGLLSNVASNPDVDIMIENGALDNGSTSNTTSINVQSNLYLYNTSLLTGGGNAFAANGSGIGDRDFRIMRGITASGSFILDNWFVIGSTFDGAANTFGTSANKNDDGVIFAFNKVLNSTGSSWNTGTNGNGADITNGMAFVQNLIESIPGGSGYNVATFFINVDTSGGPANVANAIVQYSTFVGAHLSGRQFWGYNNVVNGQNGATASVAKKLRFWSMFANINNDIYCKQDWFAGALYNETSPGLLNATNRTGGWSASYGAGSSYNLLQYNAFDQGGIGNSSFLPDALGVGAIYSTNSSYSTFRTNPLFVSDQGTTVDLVTGTPASSAYHAGAGGGDYHLQSGSPCKGAVPVSGLPYGLDGSARPATNDSCGAYP